LCIYAVSKSAGGISFEVAVLKFLGANVKVAVFADFRQFSPNFANVKIAVFVDFRQFSDKKFGDFS
jgi:hypothetical protein